MPRVSWDRRDKEASLQVDKTKKNNGFTAECLWYDMLCSIVHVEGGNIYICIKHNKLLKSKLKSRDVCTDSCTCIILVVFATESTENGARG